MKLSILCILGLVKTAASMSKMDPLSMPTHSSTMSPTKLTRASPSSLPSVVPSPSPTTSKLPSISPTRTSKPSRSMNPSSSPTWNPTNAPTITSKPSVIPTSSPTSKPTFSTSPTITVSPTEEPTQSPTSLPTVTPTTAPTVTPTSTPTDTPTSMPTDAPTEINVKAFNSVLNMFIDLFSSALNDDEKESFERVLEEHIKENEILKSQSNNVILNITSVKVISQEHSSAAENGWTTTNGMRIRSLDAEGILIEISVTGTMTYGKYPDGYVVDEVIATALNGDFNDFVSRLKSDQSFSLAIGGDDQEDIDGNDNTRKRNSIILWISVACGTGGMIMGALLLLAHSRRKKLQEFRQATDRRLNYPENSNEFNQSFTSSYIEEEKWVPEWDPNKIYEAKSGPSCTFNKSSSDDFPGSDYNSSTPMSTSTVSLGINLSPNARNEAMKHHQHFWFEPRSYSQEKESPESQKRDFSAPHTTFVTYASPGPVGVVIETTKDGPMVHSVRSTSQLLGTVMPGDIIIGLDNIETRELVAPALTRLMARKSQQEQRKITFLRPL